MVIVRASAAATSSRHGVRQVAPLEARASAPGGSDSTASDAERAADDPPKPGMSMLGIHDDEHPVRMKPHAKTAMTRLMSVPPVTQFPGRCPRAWDHIADARRVQLCTLRAPTLFLRCSRAHLTCRFGLSVAKAIDRSRPSSFATIGRKNIMGPVG